MEKVEATSKPQLAFAQSLLKLDENRLCAVCGANVNVKRYYNTVHIFDIEKKEWSLVPVDGVSPPGRYAHTTLYQPDQNCIYLLGGKGSDSVKKKNLFQFKKNK